MASKASSANSHANLQQKIQELRVADQELHAGDQSGRVFLQLSSGSAAFLTDRLVAQARVVRQLHRAIDHDERTDDNIIDA